MNMMFKHTEMGGRTMMKKFFAIGVILSMAGLANAGLLYLIDDVVIPDDHLIIPRYAVNFSVANETAATGIFDGCFVALYGDAMFGTSTLYPGMLPGQWSIQDLGRIDLGKGEVPVMFVSWDAPSIDPVKAGKLFNFEIILWDWCVRIEVLDISAEPVYSVYFVPEPMTLTLLGMGALILRRLRT
jgi:hypothetical protein